MADQLTLDVIDRPAGGALGAMRRLGALRRAAPPGTRAVIRLGTGRFVARTRPGPTPRRIGVLTAWAPSATPSASRATSAAWRSRARR